MQDVYKRQDVDTAKELLIGKTVYIQSESARVDDANNYSGYQNIAIPVNTEAVSYTHLDVYKRQA